MDRERLVNALLAPMDTAMGWAVDGLDKAGLLDSASDLVMRGMKLGLRTQFALSNDLIIEGEENVPESGGVLLASNHQSWLDVQVLGAACPRRVHFLAKEEFREWPGLRHLIRLSESVFVKRGGDDETLERMAEALRKGWAIGIYPEGTIPGEEEVPRSAVEPATGLLRGKSGVARLALMSGAPIVPVGVSGTGRALPPETYPRLEVLRPPANTPIRIRFGKPITMDDYLGRTQDRALVREVTDRLMRDISALVDHRSNYVPMEVPIAPPPAFEKIGVLLLHGFTSHTDTVSGLVPHLEAAGIPYEMPWLRGHGLHWKELRGVTARDWYVDAERALVSLAARVDRVVVVGLSMGGLVGLDLATRHPELIAGLCTVAAALRFADPLAGLTPLLAKIVPSWPSPNAFTDPNLAAGSRNYPRFPTETFGELLRYARDVEQRLGDVHVPIRVLHSKSDTVIAPVAANTIYERVGSLHREISWFEQSGHEMLQDLEADSVMADVMAFVSRFRRGPKAVASDDTRESGVA